jgi:uncharacterized membrane protein
VRLDRDDLRIYSVMSGDDMDEQDRQPTLDYVSPEVTRAEVSSGQVAGGVALSVMTIMAAVPLSMATAYAHRDEGGGVYLLLILGGVLTVLNVIAVLARRERTRRGFAQGIWIGIGLAVLLEGVCFFLMSMR